MARAPAKATTPPASKAAAPRRPAETAPVPATGRARRDMFEATWTLFCSVRFAVVQILVLAAATTLGTLIPQMPVGLRDFPTDYAAFLTDMQTRFGSFRDAMLWSGLFDLYNSFWFRLLIIIQIYSIIICTLNRWGPIWRQINPATIRSSDSFLRTMSERASFGGVPLAPAQAATALRTALRGSRYRVLEETDPADGTVYIYADRDRWSKLVTFVSHAALVMLIITAAFMASYGWREQSLVFLPGQPVDVGHGTTWTVRSDKFETEYYPGTSNVKEFLTTLSVLQANKVVETKTIRVNDPLRYQGINYFLVSTETVASIIATTPAGAPLPLNKMGQNGPITDTVGSGTEPVLLTFQFTSEENLPMDFVQVRRANTDTVTLQVVQYTDVARAPGEAPPLFVRAYIGQNFDTSYYNDFVPRSGQLVIPQFPDLRFSLKGDIAPILEVAKDSGPDRDHSLVLADGGRLRPLALCYVPALLGPYQPAGRDHRGLRCDDGRPDRPQQGRVRAGV